MTNATNGTSEKRTWYEIAAAPWPLAVREYVDTAAVNVRTRRCERRGLLVLSTVNESDRRLELRAGQEA